MALPGLRRLTGDVGLVALGQLVSYAYPLVSIPLLSRVLGIDGLGVLIAALAVIQMLIIWTDFGFGLSALRRIALAQTAQERQQVVAATIAAKLALWAAGSAALMVVVLAVPSLRMHLGLYLVGLLTSVGAVFYPMWFIQGMGRLKLLTLLTAGSRLIALAGLVLTVRSANQIELAVFWQYAPFLMSALASWIVLTRGGDASLRLAGPGVVRSALSESLPLFVNLVGGQLIVNSSVILLGQLASYRQVGLFGPADRMANAIHGVLGAVQQAMLPRVSAAHTDPDVPNHRRLILGGSITMFAASGLLLTVSAPWLVPWYLGDEFGEAVPVVQLMGLATAVAGVATTLMLDLIAAGRSRTCSIVTVMALGWHLLTASYAAWNFGAIGVAVAAGGTELFISVALSVAILRGRRSATARATDTGEAGLGDGGDGTGR